VRNGVEKFGATAIYAGEFSEILRQLDAPVIDDGGDEPESATSGSGNRMSKTERRRHEKLKKLRLQR
jgi:hypothetical protein